MGVIGCKLARASQPDSGVILGRDSNVVLIVALSARAISRSLGWAGKAAVAIDAFGDEDAREACRELLVAPGAHEGFSACDLDEPVMRLVRAHNPVGIVYGSGFEDCPEQLARLARHAPLYGASPVSVAKAKDPVRFSNLCAAAGLRHPEIKMKRPLSPEGWLIKRAGGSGGLHIRDAADAKKTTATEYWQRQIKGKSISLLFSFTYNILTQLGWSEQWTSPSFAMPYRYGGAAGPVVCWKENSVLNGLCRLAKDLGLIGLASADFIDDGSDLWLLEVNPRPGSTLDVFDDPLDPLMQRHLCVSDAREARPRPRNIFRASAIVYATEDTVIPKQEWPEWTADRPAAGTRIPKGAPVCSVRGEGEALSIAKSLLFARVGNALSPHGKDAS